MKLAILTLGAALVLAGCAAGPKADEHAAHRAAAATPEAAAASQSHGQSQGHSHGQMDAMMKSMHEMHDKMKAAKTPAERAELMKDHKKLMHEGMAMMGRMNSGKGGAAMSPEMMSKRMEMMETMMQMMVEREAAPAR